MLFEKFKENITSFWREYFRDISRADSEGKLSNKILYPNILLVTDCNGYYLAELIGASKKYSGLNLKIHKETSIDTYLTQHDANIGTNENCSLLFNAWKNSINRLTLTNDEDLSEAMKRFPTLENYKTIFCNTNGGRQILKFGTEFKSASIQHCVLVNKGEISTRAKFILDLGIFTSKISKPELIDELNHYINDGTVHGVYAITGNDDYAERLIVGSQFQNAFLFQGLRETTIGEFVRLHPEIIKKAFNTDHFIYEPSLEWKEHDGTCEDTCINPDLLVRRADGHYDIYDLKTALLDKAKLTTGERKRRQFIHTVRDGIAQLANYREYFEYPKNAEHALEKYEITVNDPKLTLIVGNLENFDAAEVSQAGRILPNVQVIDYDTLCHLFMGITPNPNESSTGDREE